MLLYDDINANEVKQLKQDVFTGETVVIGRVLLFITTLCVINHVLYC